MDLGRGKLRRAGVNILNSAVHPKFGLAWTDGKAVFVTSINIINDELRSSASVQIGTFQCVQSVGWCTAGRHLCDGLLSIMHDTSITLWIKDSSTDQLSFRLVRKVDILALPNGCLWNPHEDVLCILTVNHCALYSSHSLASDDFHLPDVSGTITCGCWSQDGQRLVIGVGSRIVMYEWSRIETKSFRQYTTHSLKIPKVDSRICALVAVNSSRFICTTELPLDQLCLVSKMDMFLAPELEERCSGDNVIENDDGSSHHNSQTEISSSSNQFLSHTQQLLTLHRNPKLMMQADSSLLILCDFVGDGLQSLSTVNLTGLLCPDILHLDATKGHIVIGSNNHNVLSVVNLVGSSLQKSHYLNLAKDERPKGLSALPKCSENGDTGVLIMVGRQTDIQFISVPSSLSAEYQLYIRWLIISSVHDLATKSGDNISHVTDIKLSTDSLLASHVSTHGSISDIGQTELSAMLAKEKFTSFDASEHLAALSCLKDCVKNIHSEKQHLISILSDHNKEDELETEFADFHMTPASFSRSVGDNKEELHGKRSLEKLMSHSPGLTSQCSSSSEPQRHSENFTAKDRNVRFPPGDILNKFNTNSAERSTVVENKVDVAEVCQQLCHQVKLLHTQLSLQADLMLVLEKKVDKILRHMDVRHHKLASTPDIVCLSPVTNGMEAGNHKAFVLDNGRLKLETVKQAFGLTTLEILVNDIPCIVGSDDAGYIPLHFTAGQTVKICAPVLNSS